MLRSIENNADSHRPEGYTVMELAGKLSWQKITLTLLIATVLFSAAAVSAASNRPTHPTAFTRKVQPIKLVEQIIPEPIDIQAVRLEDERREQEGAPYRFAISRPVVLTPDTAGTWEEIDDKTLLWRLQIFASGAQSLNLLFTRYHMPPDGILFIYAADHSEVIGSFTNNDNEEHGG